MVNLLSEKYSDGNTVLHLLCRDGKLDYIKEVIHYCDNINITNKMNWTPLHFAVNTQDNQMVNLLLLNGADPNIETSNERQTALHLAVLNGNFSVVQLLLSKNVIATSSNKNFINNIDSHGKTALTYAIIDNNSAIMKFLLDHRAAVDTRDYDCQTPFLHAYKIRNLDILNALYLRNPNIVNECDANGNNVLMNAIIDNDDQVANLMLSFSPDLNTINNDGKTVFSLCKEGYNSQSLLDTLGNMKDDKTNQR